MDRKIHNFTIDSILSSKSRDWDNKSINNTPTDPHNSSLNNCGSRKKDFGGGIGGGSGNGIGTGYGGGDYGESDIADSTTTESHGVIMMDIRKGRGCTASSSSRNSHFLLQPNGDEDDEDEEEEDYHDDDDTLQQLANSPADSPAEGIVHLLLLHS